MPDRGCCGGETMSADLPSLEKIEDICKRGWLNYYGIAGMKTNIVKIKRMAVPPDTDVYLETVGNIQDKEKEIHKDLGVRNYLRTMAQTVEKDTGIKCESETVKKA